MLRRMPTETGVPGWTEVDEAIIRARTWPGCLVHAEIAAAWQSATAAERRNRRSAVGHRRLSRSMVFFVYLVDNI
jgi:hypothetical protein